MLRGKTSGGKPPKRPIDRYEHRDKKRINNPPVGLVTPETDPPLPTHKIYDYVQPVPTVKPGKNLDYDPHLDPQLVWAGKKEHTSFEVPTVSLHVHERIDPHTIIDVVRKRNGNGSPVQPSLFERREENPPLREAIDFYRHPHGWSNRLIAGDSLLVMNSLLEKEGMAGQVQMVYIDPPYGIKYGSNFQPFVNKRDVKDGKDEDLTQEPEMIRAFRDTWELGIHSYLTYLRDRLLLAKELLTSSGSVFVQINDVNVTRVNAVIAEVFGSENFISLIPFRKTGAFESTLLATTSDFLIWYARERSLAEYRQLYREKPAEEGTGAYYRWVETPDGTRRAMTSEEKEDRSKLPLDSRYFLMSPLSSAGPSSSPFNFEFEGRPFSCDTNSHWKTTREGLLRLRQADRLIAAANRLYYVRYLDDFPVTPFDNWWYDTVAGGYSGSSIYVVQTNTKIVERCLLMTTDPGDLVLDPTCGSGTTAYVAEQWGRRWINCDTSRVAITLSAGAWNLSLSVLCLCSTRFETLGTTDLRRMPISETALQR
jgi:adenine-specific DNA-methyltransferase